MAGGRQLLVGLVQVLRRGQFLGPRERAVSLLSLPEDMSCSDPVALDPNGHVGLQPDRLFRAAGFFGDCATIGLGGAPGARVRDMPIV
jgi:hypothetical protein